MEIINKRRSVRQFTQQPVEDEKIEKLLKAGMQAPSAANQQPWEFFVIRDESIINRASKTSPYASFAAGAPLLIVVAANAKRSHMPEFIAQDLGACTENILLEAVDLGMGTTWAGVYPNDERVGYLRDVLNAPEEIIPFCIIAVGYPLREDANKFTDRYDESRVHYEQY